MTALSASSMVEGCGRANVQELLRLLQHTESETLRANVIMHHAARGPLIEDSDFHGLDADAAERLRALQVLQSVLGAGVVPEKAPTPPPPAATLPSPRRGDEIAVHELSVRVPRLAPIRLLEAADSDQATQIFKENGQKDPFGSKAWPSAYLVAERLLGEDLTGCSVLELGCGTGLVSIAAALRGASQVLATDRAEQNLDCVRKSARLNGAELKTQVFDVMSKDHLPCPQRTKFFDFVVFSDVLYWPEEAIAFGRRAAEAYSSGSTVIVADPGRRRDDFLGGLRGELGLRLAGKPWPNLDLKPVSFPAHVFDWVSAEVQTASRLFCEEPFMLVLRPEAKVAQKQIHFEIVD